MSELKQARYFDPQHAAEPAPLQAASQFAAEAFIAEPASNDSAAVKQSPRWWWRLAGCTLLTIVLLAVWQWGLWLEQSWQQSPVYGAVLTFISLALALLLAALLWREPYEFEHALVQVLLRLGRHARVLGGDLKPFSLAVALEAVPVVLQRRQRLTLGGGEVRPGRPCHRPRSVPVTIAAGDCPCR